MKMKFSYIDLLNRFWRLDAEKPFSAIDTRLYMYLLQQFNLGRWPDSIELSTRKLEYALGISRKQIQAAKRRLEQRGLISFTTGNRSKSPVYTLHYGSNEVEAYASNCIPADNKISAKSAEKDTQEGNINDTQSGPISETINNNVSATDNDQPGTPVDKGSAKVSGRVAGNIDGNT